MLTTVYLFIVVFGQFLNRYFPGIGLAENWDLKLINWDPIPGTANYLVGKLIKIFYMDFSSLNPSIFVSL